MTATDDVSPEFAAATSTAQRVTINGNELAVEVLGPEDAPVILTHHGAPGLGSRAEPRASFGRLADEYRVVVFDARGSGASEGSGTFSHEQWAADLDALREWAGAERVAIAGGSYGGFMAMEYAIRYPERVAAVVLQRDDDALAEVVEVVQRGEVHARPGAVTGPAAGAGGYVSCRKSRTTRVHSSASSIWGECPECSKMTRRASGISSVMVCEHDTGVIQSVLPTVTRVGAVTPGSCGLRS